MIVFPLYYFLFAYILFLALILIFSFFNVYHMIKYGFLSFESVVMTFVFLCGIIFILFLTYEAGTNINWQQIIEIGFGPSII